MTETIRRAYTKTFVADTAEAAADAAQDEIDDAYGEALDADDWDEVDVDVQQCVDGVEALEPETRWVLEYDTVDPTARLTVRGGAS